MSPSHSSRARDAARVGRDGNASSAATASGTAARKAASAGEGNGSSWCRSTSYGTRSPRAPPGARRGAQQRSAAARRRGAMPRRRRADRGAISAATRLPTSSMISDSRDPPTRRPISAVNSTLAAVTASAAAETSTASSRCPFDRPLSGAADSWHRRTGRRTVHCQPARVVRPGRQHLRYGCRREPACMLLRRRTHRRVPTRPPDACRERGGSRKEQ